MSEVKSKIKRVSALKQRGKVLRDTNPLLAVFQWGCNHMMNEAELVSDQPLILDRDFKAFSKVQVHNQYYNEQELPNKFKVKEYCPVVFKSLRHRFGEDPADYLTSICDGQIYGGKSTGKGGGDIYYTHDHRLVIKTLAKEEVASFHHTFKQYYSYIVECDGDTLLARYLGMYRITVHEKETYMVVMNSIRPVGIPTHRLYDLKGSKVDRKASDKERAKDLPCLKDIDFEEAQERLYLGGDTETFKETLKRDVQFLEKHNLMDYSLLVAIHDCNEQTPGEIDRDVDVYHVGPHAKDLKADPKRLYFIGIIDVLTVYSTRKRAAHAAKTAKHGARAEISTVKPDQYAKRLLEFVSSMLA
ncbi:hypothetical protein PTSG_00009 [Salpingoeca rosetta]|uniref:PIPK domain-containing protein n=1 Tax=Salpingoeca rosetta (strain ATCC 50818 / BSB-021) TaxID=946362 RepID=F2TV97_SALR5|nr:uncharacterized protein PTSG_00009 [Salpingoeca rosetta]EGD71993.1 hypothetical protein PTSG_00009 [Salpingoeca rosetta]|eukprot:XP_004998565.1 hypothetical protein PTSG_00009 [Salpingoeca rosetta]